MTIRQVEEFAEPLQTPSYFWLLNESDDYGLGLAEDDGLPVIRVYQMFSEMRWIVFDVRFYMRITLRRGIQRHIDRQVIMTLEKL